MGKVRQFVARVVRFFDWLPVLWRDNDWDWVFVLILLRHKLERMVQYWDRKRRHVGWEKDVRHMKIAILLIDRLVENDYYTGYGEVDSFSWINADKSRRSDLKTLCLLLERHLMDWWD